MAFAINASQGVRPDWRFDVFGKEFSAAGEYVTIVLLMQEFETATGLHHYGTQRPVSGSPRELRLERVTAGQLPLARELDRLYAELDKLRAILREHGIDAGDDPA